MLPKDMIETAQAGVTKVLAGQPTTKHEAAIIDAIVAQYAEMAEAAAAVESTVEVRDDPIKKLVSDLKCEASTLSFSCRPPASESTIYHAIANLLESLERRWTREAEHKL